jgi:hypothetical protein
MNFSYRQYNKADGSKIYRPEIPVRVTGPAGGASFFALLDTGSDRTILPRRIGERIGAEMDNSTAVTALGVGGQQVQVVPGAVDLELVQGKKRYRWRADVAFISLPDPKREVTLLGHRGFLEFFDVTFYGENRKVRLRPGCGSRRPSRYFPSH